MGRRKLTHEEIEERVIKHGYKLEKKHRNKRKNLTVEIVDSGGYGYSLLLSDLGRISPAPFSKTNPYTMLNIKTYLYENEKNFTVDEEDCFLGSEYKLNFHCNVCDDIFVMLWSNARRNGCPLCRGLQVGEKNSLHFLRPDMASEWSEKNNLSPREITVGSGKKVLWVCKDGHEWRMSPHTRTSMGCGCPKCAEKLTESKIATEIKKFAVKNCLGVETEYRVLINPETGRWLPYDIYIPSKEDVGIYVEIMGKQHYEVCGGYYGGESELKKRKKRDRLKKKYALENGYFLEVDNRNFKSPKDAVLYFKEKLEEIVYKCKL